MCVCVCVCVAMWTRTGGWGRAGDVGVIRAAAGGPSTGQLLAHRDPTATLLLHPSPPAPPGTTKESHPITVQLLSPSLSPSTSHSSIQVLSKLRTTLPPQVRATWVRVCKCNQYGIVCVCVCSCGWVTGCVAGWLGVGGKCEGLRRSSASLEAKHT